MKIWILIGIVISFTSCGRKIASSSLPEPVQVSFHSQFPLAKNAEWKQKHHRYTVNFHDSTEYMYAKYKQDGTLKKAIRQCTAACLNSN